MATGNKLPTNAVEQASYARSAIRATHHAGDQHAVVAGLVPLQAAGRLERLGAGAARGLRNTSSDSGACRSGRPWRRYRGQRTCVIVTLRLRAAPRGAPRLVALTAASSVRASVFYLVFTRCKVFWTSKYPKTLPKTLPVNTFSEF